MTHWLITQPVGRHSDAWRFFISRDGYLIQWSYQERDATAFDLRVALAIRDELAAFGYRCFVRPGCLLP